MSRRVILLIICMLVIAWLGFGLRSVALQRAAAGPPRRGISAQQDLSKRLQWLHDAQFLTPSPAPLRAEVELLLYVGRTRPALAAAERLVRREPAAYEAWLLLIRAADGLDPRRAAMARREAFKLNPLAARGG
jgi:hypothetical protein